MIFSAFMFILGLSVVASLGVEDCKGAANFSFKQGRFESWRYKGRSTSRNYLDASRKRCHHWADDRGIKAAKVKPWDLDFHRRYAKTYDRWKSREIPWYLVRNYPPLLIPLRNPYWYRFL